ncbi:MAG: hypothetical protein KAT15_25495, partial [Bacteroidales bacterium]|nr:hypothetical protein [Bacteroidales bacterium]
MKYANLSRYILAPVMMIMLIGFHPDLLYAKEKKKNDTEEKTDSIDAKIFTGLKWRSIGPAMTSGRVADFAVNPKNHSEW